MRALYQLQITFAAPREVLLYGNSSGGVIQAFTKAAPKAPEAAYQYYVGDYGMHRANYQFASTVGPYGLVADYGTFTTDGYRDNSKARLAAPWFIHGTRPAQ